jgi:hypothetical protein
MMNLTAYFREADRLEKEAHRQARSEPKRGAVPCQAAGVRQQPGFGSIVFRLSWTLAL